MNKAAPWVKFFTSDFLTGVGDLAADEIGVYTVILALMWDRGAPIPDDPAWLARRSGTSTRRFNQIRAKLIAAGKLEARNGLLGNRRAIAEVEARDKKSSQARSAALQRWHGHNEPELPLETNADYPEIKTGKTQEQIDLKTPKEKPKPQKPADSSMRTHDSLSRARATPEDSEESDSTHPDSVELTPEPGRLANADLKDLYDAVVDATGFRSSSPEAIDRALKQVERWKAEGVDFETIVLPTIRKAVADSSEPTRTLGRFVKAVAHEHARAKAKGRNGQSYEPPSSPVLEPAGEDPVFRPIRAQLLERLGAKLYCWTANRVTFEDGREEGSTRLPMIIKGPSHEVEELRHGRTSTLLRTIAKAHGFTDVW